MTSKLPEVLNFNRIFLKLNQFVCKQRQVLPVHCFYFLSTQGVHNIIQLHGCVSFYDQHLRSEMTLNYWMIMERHPFSNGLVGGSNPTVISSFYFTEKTSQVGRKPRAHPTQGRQYTLPNTKRILEQGRANGLKLTSDCLTLVIYLFSIDMGLHYLTFTRRNLENKKKLAPVQIMNNASLISKNIVNSVSIFNKSDAMNSYLRE